MKKILVLVLLSIGVFTLSACGNKEVLYLYNWGAYIDNDSMEGVNLIKKFEKKYNCKVQMNYFDSNEQAITIMETEDYDIVIPSEYAIEQLASEDKLEKIDWNLVEGFTKDDIIGPLKSLLSVLKESENGFDFLEYAVPYFWGSVGICYNKDVVTQEELDTYGWSIFKQSKYKDRVAYYDSSRDGYMVALKDLGYSMNTTNKEEVAEATQWLDEMIKNVNSRFKTDELLSEMPDLKYNLALMYSGDALYVMQMAEETGKNLGFYVPKNKGTNVFADGMVIPKNAQNKELAYKFISFMCETENAVANSEYVGYTTSVNSAYVELTSEGGTFEDYKETYLPEYRKDLDEIFRYNKEMKVYLGSEWLKVKAKS